MGTYLRAMISLILSEMDSVLGIPTEYSLQCECCVLPLPACCDLFICAEGWSNLQAALKLNKTLDA